MLCVQGIGVRSAHRPGCTGNLRENIMSKTINITPAQLATAQVRGETALDEGYILTAVPLDDGNWKYILSWGGQVGLVRYAKPGLDAAKWAINASEEDADEGRVGLVRFFGSSR
jgi:hypothetical protein